MVTKIIARGEQLVKQGRTYDPISGGEHWYDLCVVAVFTNNEWQWF